MGEQEYLVPPPELGEQLERRRAAIVVEVDEDVEPPGLQPVPLQPGIGRLPLDGYAAEIDP